MADAYRRLGMADRPATFSLFVRDLPPERGLLVAAGLDDALSWLETLAFGPEELSALERLDVFGADFIDWLAELRFTGAVRAVPEGTVVFAHEPLLEVEAPLAQAQVAETFLLNQVTLQTMLATKAARCRHAAAGRPVADFALRRTQGVDAGMKLARVARLVGLASTSNVAGADRYGLAVTGTMAHAFVQAHDDEADAFRRFASVAGDAAVLLVDTYDTERGIERAVAVAKERQAEGGSIRALRIDSGDLDALARHARRRLDEEGLTGVQVFVSGGLDEHAVHRLVAGGAPVDAFGVGTSMGVSADAPSLNSVYKLVAYEGRPVFKRSEGKETWPGAKQVWRAPGWSGDTLALADEAEPSPGDLPLLEEVMAGGRRTAAGERTLAEAHDHFEAQWAGVPEHLKDLTSPAAHPVEVSAAIRALVEEQP